MKINIVNDKTINDIGRRIKEVRNYLLMTQQQMSDASGVSVLAISKIEHGKQTTSVALLKIISFCSNYISLDFLFAKDFSITDAANYTKSFSMNTVVKARLDMIRGDMNSSLEKTRKQLEQQLMDTTALL